METPGKRIINLLFILHAKAIHTSVEGATHDIKVLFLSTKCIMNPIKKTTLNNQAALIMRSNVTHLFNFIIFLPHSAKIKA